MGFDSGYGGCGWTIEKERIRAIGLQCFMGFKFFIFYFLLFGCGFVLQMSC